MLCPNCNQEIPDGTTVCPNCVTAINDQPISPTGIPVKSQDKPSRLSKTALIFTFLSIVLCFCAPIALILGLIELYRIKKGLASPLGRANARAAIATGLIITLLIPHGYNNFKAAQTRSKVSRAKDEQNLLATGLEAFYKEHKTYPLPDYDTQGNPIVPRSLTTPVVYITALPYDLFSEKMKQRYHYSPGPAQDTVKTHYIITSNGPNKKMDLNISKYNQNEPYWANLSTALGTYDPTNGTVSIGDIWRKGP